MGGWDHFHPAWVFDTITATVQLALVKAMQWSGLYLWAGAVPTWYYQVINMQRVLYCTIVSLHPGNKLGMYSGDAHHSCIASGCVVSYLGISLRVISVTSFTSEINGTTPHYTCYSLGKPVHVLMVHKLWMVTWAAAHGGCEDDCELHAHVSSCKHHNHVLKKGRAHKALEAISTETALQNHHFTLSFPPCFLPLTILKQAPMNENSAANHMPAFICSF